MYRRWITEPSPILSLYASPMFTRASPMCRRCVAVVYETFLTLVYIAECSPTARRCLAIWVKQKIGVILHKISVPRT